MLAASERKPGSVFSSLSLSGSHNEVSLLPESAERRRSRKEKEKKTVKDEKVARKEGQTGTEKEREKKKAELRIHGRLKARAR